MMVGSGLTTNYELVIEQPIGKLTPEMLDWWWDNIKDTARYHRWHPTAHQAAHCVQEMQFLQYFVPSLFAAEYHPSRARGCQETRGRSQQRVESWHNQCARSRPT
jgi:hypothetical protein